MIKFDVRVLLASNHLGQLVERQQPIPVRVTELVEVFPLLFARIFGVGLALGDWPVVVAVFVPVVQLPFRILARAELTPAKLAVTVRIGAREQHTGEEPIVLPLAILAYAVQLGVMKHAEFTKIERVVAVAISERPEQLLPL